MTELILIVRNRPYFFWGIVGGLMIMLFLWLSILAKSVPAHILFTWQVVTGLILTLAIAYQWVLLFVRMAHIQKSMMFHYKAHRWVGVTSTAFFALHAISFGYAWTNALAIVFCASAVTGLLNKEIIRYRREWVFNLWYWAHMTLSISLLPLIAIHIWVALAYEGI